jgi:hypothetical protein
MGCTVPLKQHGVRIYQVTMMNVDLVFTQQFLQILFLRKKSMIALP